MDIEPIESVNTLVAFAHEQSREMVGGLIGKIQGCHRESYSLWAHSLAVASTARRLSVVLGLSNEERRLSYIGGLLHDVGKTAVSPDTLFKPGPLTQSERNHLNLHPGLGADMVANLNISQISDAVHFHHELYDGSGYPFGMAGDEIPLAARIVGVADYYEALRESRPYRPMAATSAEALEVIRSLSAIGKLDPEISRALPSIITVRPEQHSKYFERVAGFFAFTS